MLLLSYYPLTVFYFTKTNNDKIRKKEIKILYWPDHCSPYFPLNTAKFVSVP